MSKVISIRPARKPSYINLLQELKIKYTSTLGLPAAPSRLRGESILQVVYVHPSLYKGWEFFSNELEFE